MTYPEADATETGSLAVVVGSSGGLGSALMTQLEADGSHARVVGLGRQGNPRIDFLDETSIATAAQTVANDCRLDRLELRLLIVATGFLHGQVGQPERSLAQLDAAYLNHAFKINSIGPALVMKHFLPLLPRSGRCVAGFLSARVGSIGDNALGGWYGYRASKAALNQLVKTAAIELSRRNRHSICVALHPGTVDTPLSQPFAKASLTVRPPAEAAADLLRVLTALTPADTGALMDFRGARIAY